MLRARLIVRGDGSSWVGADRIRLLEEIARTGSISAAARSMGLSYKGAWNAVAALNALTDRPLVTARTGGRNGGAAWVTKEGLALVLAFRSAESEAAVDLNRKLASVMADREPQT